MKREQQEGGRQIPPEIMHAQLVAQHAQGIMSDMLKGGLKPLTPDSVVSEAFAMADAFDNVFQKRMHEAAKKISPIEKPPPGLVIT